MNGYPQVSIIIPARNAAVSINRCLDSIVKAAVNVSLEVILVLNGCKDKTVELAYAYADLLPIKLHLDESVLGPAAARNIGIKMAKGVWLYFLDADDLIPDGALDSHSQIMKKTKSHVLVGSYIKATNKLSINTHLLNEAIKFDPATMQKYILKYVYEPYFYTMPVHCWGKLYLRSSVISAGILFNESLDQLEDVNFNFSLILNGLTFEFTDQVLYQYHINSAPNSLSSQSGDAPHALERIQSAYMPVQALLKNWENSGSIKNASNYTAHLFATTSLLWLIRTGKKFGYHNWASCKSLVSRIVNNQNLRCSMRFYRQMPGTSRVIPFLVRLNSISLLCLYFKIKATFKRLPYVI
jgi:glycosyltransferase involved in cell wall biosynthesis